MTITDNNDWIKFSDWWYKSENHAKAEQKFGKEAERICNEIDPKNKMLNLYTDTLEKLAWENKLHKN
jgi:hypothetical protein